MTRTTSWVALLAGLVFCGVREAAGQDAGGTLRVRAVSEEGPVAAATVRAGGVGALTDDRGEATLVLPAGRYEVLARKLGFADTDVEAEVATGRETLVVMTMLERAEDIEGVVVTSTRTERRIEDEPVRVEVLTREEVEEKLLMTPGDIAMLLNETSGIRVQSTSPSLGGANVRIQGLRGRYTQILSDGLPLHGGQSGALSMLQIPPMDLGQVEVIKGASSALYGSSALGGVVNLISRRPDGDREVLLNQTTLDGTDGILWLSGNPGERWGYTLLAGLHRQGRADLDGDGWSDLAGYRRAVLRPRLFWNDGTGRSVLVTVGTTLEDREGGTQDGRLTPAGTTFVERLQTRRADFGGIARFLMGGGARLLTVRVSGMGQRHEHRFGETRERDLHTTAFGEVAYSGSGAGHIWVIGAALQRESYAAEDVDGFDSGVTTPSVFAQDEYSPTGWLTLAARGRLDRHGEHGVFVSPRVSTLLRAGEWTARFSVGTGYFAPTPFTEETEAVGLARLEPLGALDVETARGGSLDLGRTFGELEVNGTLFGSAVEHALHARPEGTRLRLVNSPAPTRTVGGELLARWQAEPLHLTASYTVLRSTESGPEGEGRREVPLTPRHATGLVAMWEAEETARVGVEVYFTGRQELEENPYRTRGRPYVVTGIFAERRFGNARVFVNAENLLDVRQTKHDPLILPARSPGGRWTTDVWAPLEGRVFNAGIRYEF